ncbi:hypothetical protein V7S43_000004 [Phytophthora oleae]|uniref:Uncharacterized protein n=1 Tax=Phytophthora oleae TaxID=2107226 RepID=A0ABD3G633_9STRA
MEQTQREFLAQERLAFMERQPRREQRDLDARRQIQTLTDRLLESENASLEAQRRADDLEEHRSQASDRKPRDLETFPDIERLRTELQNSEKQRLESEFADRWQQLEAEAVAERARWAEEMKND